VLARTAGKTSGELLRTRITGPLGMKSTFVGVPGEVRGRVAAPYDGAGNPAKNWDLPSVAGAGAIVSSVNDMLLWARANIAPPDDPLGKAVAAAQVVRAEDTPRMGLGWHFDGTRLTHSGQTGGYHAYVAVDRASGRAIVVLANTGNGAPDQLGGVLWRIVSGTQPKEIALSPEALAAFAGSYDFGVGKLTVTVEDGKLMAQMTGQQKFPIHASADDEFFWKVVEARIVFTRDAAGKVTGATIHQAGAEISGKRE
jgi:CubicO group peptidase (beta-lactamase class C family)